MFQRTATILAVLLTFMTLQAQAQTATAATGASSARTESFWHEAPSLVPIKLLVPADDPAGNPVNGTASEQVYFITNGKAEISQRIAGNKRVMAVLQKGDFFGEMA